MARDIRKGFFFGKKALITGGSSGIGLALARQLVARGASVWLVARDPAKLESACKELKAAAADPSQTIGSTQADVSVESQAKGAVDQATRALDSLDLVFNNAGVTYVGYFQDIKAEIFREVMEINYFGTLNVIRAVVPGMIRRGRGHLVNVSSGAAYLALFGYSPYAPSKWAVRGLSDVLRYELKPLGIRVSLVMPSNTDTPQLEEEVRNRPPELETLSAGGKVYPAKDVARDILSGVERNRYIIIPAMDATLFYWLTNILGPLQYPVIDLLVADAIRKKKKAAEKQAGRV
jgi:3-dehydrosphinganine reductase